MFGVALGIRFDEFKDIIKNPKPFIAGALSQIVFLPAVTFLVIIILHKFISPTVAMGMILVSACPGGNISNFISSIAKARIELSVSLTAFSTLAAIITTPLNFALWGGLYIDYMAKRSTELLQPITIDAIQMFYTVFILLGIPLTLGMLSAKYFPKFSKIISPWMQRFSIFAFIAMLVIAFYSNIDIFINYIFYIFIIVLIHNGSALLTGYATGTVFKLKDSERRATTIETGIQNSGLGLALLLNPKIFPQDLALGGMLIVTAWWGIWHIISGLTLGFIWKKKPLKN
jgi:BASS family bile acid:Na+ symporter